MPLEKNRPPGNKRSQNTVKITYCGVRIAVVARCLWLGLMVSLGLKVRITFISRKVFSPERPIPGWFGIHEA